MPLPNNIDEASATLCWVSLSERRWVNFAERYRPDPLMQLNAH